MGHDPPPPREGKEADESNKQHGTRVDRLGSITALLRKERRNEDKTHVKQLSGTLFSKIGH